VIDYKLDALNEPLLFAQSLSTTHLAVLPIIGWLRRHTCCVSTPRSGHEFFKAQGSRCRLSVPARARLPVVPLTIALFIPGDFCNQSFTYSVISSILEFSDLSNKAYLPSQSTCSFRNYFRVKLYHRPTKLVFKSDIPA
jgi:hypothetical protein